MKSCYLYIMHHSLFPKVCLQLLLQQLVRTVDKAQCDIAPADTILHSSAPSNVLTITEACLVDNSVSVQWMVSEAVSMYV